LATIAIFLPAFLLIMGTLPFWDTLRRNPKCRGALFGINAAVVGILIAASYTPIWTSSILSAKDFAFGSILFSMLVFWKLPPWVIVINRCHWWVSSNASLILGFSYLIIAMKNEEF
jgi:chromate transporter